MDDETIYKAAKLEYHIAIDSDKTKDFAFDCAIIEAIKQARASERAEITERLNRQWKLAYDLCEDRATQNGIKKGQAELIEKAEKASLQGDYDNAFVWVDTLERLASESLGEHGGLADGIGDKRCGKSNTRQSSSKDAGYKRSASPPSNPKPEKPELVYYDLMHCDRCIQETNHRNGVCQKCKPKKQRRRNGGYKGRL